MIDAIEMGDTGPLEQHLEASGQIPTPEEIAKLAAEAKDTGLSPTIPSDLRQWLASRTTRLPTTTAKPLSNYGAKELAKFAGVESLPPEVEAAIAAGNYAVFTDWLDDQDIHTTKLNYQRLKAGAKAFDLPDELMDAVDEWFDRTLPLGAVTALDTFAGVDVPKEILDAIEAGNNEPLIDWLGSEGLAPDLIDLKKLEKRASKVGLPPSVIESLRQWLDNSFNYTLPITSTMAAPSTKKRTTPEGQTTTPPFPLNEAEETAVAVMQTVGCVAIIGILAGTILLYAIVVRDWCIERFIHFNQEMALLMAHLLILFLRDRVDIHVPCKLTAMALQYLYLVNASFLALEALQAYAITTGIITFGGVFNRKQLFAVGWTLPGLYTGLTTAFLHDDLTSYWSCWLNMGEGVALGTFVPLGLLSAATIVMVEAAGMGEWPLLEGTDVDQHTAAMLNSKGLLFTLPANIGSWGVGFYAVYSANVALYGMVTLANVTLAVVIFSFHTLGNPKVHQLVKKIRGR